ncbi:MAG: M1 family metallopeptidase [Bacteroidales bacterium]|nr:M1 family metallopeptidase [Bacteroidales bacterium]
MRKIIISVILSTFSLVLMAQESFLVNKTAQVASYKIDAELNTDAKMITGNEILTWINTSNDTISELMFHTYLNAFKNSESTFFKESERECGWNLSNNLDSSEWGYIDILRMVTLDGEPLTQDLKYVSPDTGNRKDQTVMSVKLPRPLYPGGVIKLNISFLSKLPKIISRTGYERGDFYLVGQWFPKIAVYEPAGMRNRKKSGWNCHEFHYNSEFYADFGTYDVSITLPDKYVVGATGVETYNAVDGGRKTVKFHAEDVLDFAWTASPRFKTYKDSYEVGGQTKAIKLLYLPEHSGKSDRYIESLKHAMEYMYKNVGEYPYSQITVVDVPFYALGASGMEYPMFITVNVSDQILGLGCKDLESVTVHEFVHNYFMATVASNEAEEAWLDEGFTQFYETQIMDSYYSDGSLFNLMGFKVNSFESTRLEYTQSYNPAIACIDNFSWKYPTHTYGMLVYQKTATMLATIRGLLGEEKFNRAMKMYYEKWKFKHPCGQDFFNCINQIVAEINDPIFGNNLNWFFHSAFKTDQVCDYKLTKIVNDVVFCSEKGWFDSGLEKILGEENDSTVVKSFVYVQRMGTMVMPVEILVKFKNGETELVKWDGKGRCKEFSFTKNSSIVSAQIDPENKIACDIDLVNNSISYENNSSNPIWKYASKFLFWLENIFMSIAFFA